MLCFPTRIRESGVRRGVVVGEIVGGAIGSFGSELDLPVDSVFVDEDVIVSGINDGPVGGLVGVIDNSFAVTNVSSRATVAKRGSGAIGGLFGVMKNASVVLDWCYFDVSITVAVDLSTGAIVGVRGGTTSLDSRFGKSMLFVNRWQAAGDERPVAGSVGYSSLKDMILDATRRGFEPSICNLDTLRLIVEQDSVVSLPTTAPTISPNLRLCLMHQLILPRKYHASVMCPTASSVL